MAARLLDYYIGQQRARDRLPVQRAVEWGELRRDTDINVAVNELLGPIYYRVLLAGQPVPREFTTVLCSNFSRKRENRDYSVESRK